MVPKERVQTPRKVRSKQTMGYSVARLPKFRASGGAKISGGRGALSIRQERSGL